MTESNYDAFYTSVVSAGAILTGLAGTFLQFRIGREASYYQQPVPFQLLDKETQKPILDSEDIPIFKRTNAEINLSVSGA
jgi:hypothetical protein